MNGDLDPYATPQTDPSPSQMAAGSMWKILDGSLWVRPGAILPEICLYGSSPGGLKRELVKIQWAPRSATILGMVLGMVGTVTLMGYSWFERPGLTGMMQAVFLAVLATTAIQALVFRRNWKSRRITVGGSKGRKRWVLVAVVVLAFYGISSALLAVLDRLFDGISADQELKIGLGHSLMFLWVVSLHVVIVLLLIRAVETRDGWYRLAGVHPGALAELKRLQAGAHANPGT
jgi:hypothetical protein